MLIARHQNQIIGSAVLRSPIPSCARIANSADPQQDVAAAVGVHDAGHLAHLQREARVLERFLHLSAPEEAQVTA